MNVRLRMYKYCYSNKGAIYAKGLLFVWWSLYTYGRLKTKENLIFNDHDHNNKAALKIIFGNVNRFASFKS